MQVVHECGQNSEFDLKAKSSFNNGLKINCFDQTNNEIIFKLLYLPKSIATEVIYL
jgi:hypothetical protein